MTEYAELKAQTADFDPVELYKARNAIRPVQEKEVEQKLEGTMHEKPSLIMMLSAKQEMSRLLGEDAGAAGSLTGAAELFRFWVFPDCTFLDISKTGEGEKYKKNAMRL